MSHCIYKMEFYHQSEESQVTWWKDKSDRAGGAARYASHLQLSPLLQHATKLSSIACSPASWEPINTLVDFLSSGWTRKYLLWPSWETVNEGLTVMQGVTV